MYLDNIKLACILFIVKINSKFKSLMYVPSDPLTTVPSLKVDSVTTSVVRYRVRRSRNDAITKAVIAGYEVTRFGVPMIGQYVNTGRGRRVTISPAVPGTQYRITAWALGDGRRSATPAVEYATPGEASECAKGCIWIRQYVVQFKK